MERSLQSNIWKYAVFLVTKKRVFVAILGAYYMTIPGVTPGWIGTILLISMSSGFLLEIPSGYASDKLGHKKALILSSIFLIASTLFFLFATNIAFLILAGILLSAGVSFHSGTGSAFMHETLRGLKREEDYARVIGKLSSIGYAVPIALTVLIPFLVSISYKLPFVIALVTDLVGLAVTISLVKPPVSQEDVKEIGVTNFRQVMQEGYRLRFFGLAFFSGIAGGFLFAVGGFRAPYQLFLDVPVIWYGVFFGAGRALASLFLAFSGRIRGSMTFNSFYGFQLALYSILILALGAAQSAWLVVAIFLLINAFQWGLDRVDESHLIDRIRASKFKATLISARSQIYQATGAVFSFGLGFAIQRYSYQQGFAYLGIAFLAVLLPLYLYIVRSHKRMPI